MDTIYLNYYAQLMGKNILYASTSASSLPTQGSIKGTMVKT